MSDNEEEQELKSVDEQLSTANVKPTTLNKNGKPRRQLSPGTPREISQSKRKSQCNEKAISR
jgi:hypothetical protein